MFYILGTILSLMRGKLYPTKGLCPVKNHELAAGCWVKSGAIELIFQREVVSKQQTMWQTFWLIEVTLPKTSSSRLRIGRAPKGQ